MKGKQEEGKNITINVELSVSFLIVALEKENELKTFLVYIKKSTTQRQNDRVVDIDNFMNVHKKKLQASIAITVNDSDSDSTLH